MRLETIVMFVVAYAAAVSVPGAGIAALLARVLSRGHAGIAAFFAGFIVGDIIWFTVAATGMAAMANTVGPLFTIIRFFGAAYLLYIAYRLITTRLEPVDLNPQAVAPTGVIREFISSLTLSLGNPKVILFFMALLPTVIDFSSLTLLTGIEVALLICLVQSMVLAVYTIAAARARNFFTNRSAMRALNLGMGTIIAGVAVLVATR